jgi:hypothetical protein
MLEIDALYRDRILLATTSSSSSSRLQSSVCPSTAYSIRRDAWLHARRSSAAALLQAAARVVHAHACLRQKRAAETLQAAWRQHAAVALARAAGGKAGRAAAVKIQSVWRGHWLRVKKVCVLAYGWGVAAGCGW